MLIYSSIRLNPLVHPLCHMQKQHKWACTAASICLCFVTCTSNAWTFGAASICSWSVTHRGRYEHLQQLWQIYVVWHAEVCGSFYSWSSQAEPGCQWCSHQLVRRLASCKEVRGGSIHALHNYLFNFSLHIYSVLMKPLICFLKGERYCLTRLLCPWKNDLFSWITPESLLIYMLSFGPYFVLFYSFIHLFIYYLLTCFFCLFVWFLRMFVVYLLSTLCSCTLLVLHIHGACCSHHVLSKTIIQIQDPKKALCSRPH